MPRDTINRSFHIRHTDIRTLQRPENTRRPCNSYNGYPGPFQHGPGRSPARKSFIAGGTHPAFPGNRLPHPSFDFPGIALDFPGIVGQTGIPDRRAAPERDQCAFDLQTLDHKAAESPFRDRVPLRQHSFTGTLYCEITDTNRLPVRRAGKTADYNVLPNGRHAKASVARISASTFSASNAECPEVGVISNFARGQTRYRSQAF